MVIPHALVVPGLGQSHLSGCLLLSKALSSVGFKASFVYFSSTYAHLKKKNLLESSTYAHLKKKNLLEDSAESSVAVHVVEDGRDPDLPPASTFDANPTLEENLYKLLIELQESGHGVTCLVSDSFVPWTQHVTERAGIPRVEFWSSTAFSNLMVIHCEALFNRGIFPDKGSQELWKSENPVTIDHIPGITPFPSTYYPREFRFANIDNPHVQFCIKLTRNCKRCERLLVPSVFELEPEAFNAIQLAGIHAYSVGPLLHYLDKSQSTLENLHPCLTWLNKHPPKSVLYIAFGTRFNLPKEEIHELAHALEDHGCPFLWALREDNLEEVLPEGFLANTNANGMVIPWAPQIDVLAHPSIGGFLSHCGWNSTLESLWCGIPIIGCPRGADQSANMNHITKSWGVGFELERNTNGGIEKRGVLDSINKLMDEPYGQQARHKARQIMELMRKTCLPGGQSRTNLEKFYEEMKTLCSSKK